MTKIEVPLSQLFQPYAEAALARLRYLYPSCSFDLTETSVAIQMATSVNDLSLKRDVSYQLYREKIYHDTLSMRAAMYQALLT